MVPTNWVKNEKHPEIKLRQWIEYHFLYHVKHPLRKQLFLPMHLYLEPRSFWINQNIFFGSCWEFI